MNYKFKKINCPICEDNNEFSIVYNQNLPKNNIGLMVGNIHIISQKK